MAAEKSGFREDLLQYTWVSREEGYPVLEADVVFNDLCCGCGACEAVCPEDVIQVGEFPKLTGKCSNCGYCIIQCPRSFFPSREIEENLFGQHGDILGHIEFMTAAKAKTDGQDGGVVTALVEYMFSKRLIDGAVISTVDRKQPWKPRPVLVTKKADVKKGAGSKYSVSPNVSVLKEAHKKGLKKLAFVGLPCQTQAIRKMQAYPVGDIDYGSMVKYTIGIFCKANFLYEMLEKVVAGKFNLKKVTKFDIKGKNLNVYQGDEKTDVPLKEIHRYQMAGCSVCTNFAARLADFAIGSVGSPAGYSTVFARTKDAAKLIKDMKKAKLISTKKITDEKFGLPLVERLAKLQRDDSRRTIWKKSIDALPMPFKFLIQE
ncbi:MAG: coenzyme F420 hydrogenase subunit beta [Euryarchaeota archaeon]|nr:coenzyme F420 hydrogenase subunit beta [Euryarchaeota archaeon]